VKKRGRSGARGIPKVDKVLDKEMFIDKYTDENGKHIRLGKFRLSHEVNNLLANIAYQLKVSRSELVRTILETYVRHYQEAKEVNARPYLTPALSIESWLQERNDFTILMNQLKEQNRLIQENSKSPEVKVMSTQMAILAQMLNLTNKNVI
jgi:hypothetical protein